MTCRVAFGIYLSAFALACGSTSSASNFSATSDAGTTATLVVAEGAAPLVQDGSVTLKLEPVDATSPPEVGPSEGGGSSTLSMTIRDFKMWNASDPATNPDFQNEVGDDRGIVQTTLGADGKPAYETATPTTLTTHGKADFDEWYNDTPGMNISVSYPIPLTPQANGTYGYDSLVSGVPTNPPSDPAKGFFPIDDGTPYATTFGNEGEPHNYSFTTELHTVFTYTGGETFSFSGDDDVFVFINRALVINLGGVHNREDASVALDSLGLVKGQQYPLDLFGAERHMIGSNVSFQTTLALSPAPPLAPK